MPDVSLSACDFCGDYVQFCRVTPDGGPFWHLAPVLPGAGSDYLATWCEQCGPQHRNV